MGKTKSEIQKRNHEILVELDQMDELVRRENRLMNQDEEIKYKNLLREHSRLHAELESMADEKELAKMREEKSKSEQLREIFKKCREDKVAFSEVMHKRAAANSTTVLKDSATGNTAGNIEAAGAVPLVINEIIDTKVPGLERPDDMKILTGVKGNQVWPYAIDDVEFTVADEVEPIGEQNISFAKLNAAPVRVSAALAVSNYAIDEADFDLYAFCTYKMQKGMAKFWALYTYSHCKVSHALKPVFSLVTVEELTLDENIGKNLAKKAAAMWDLGFEGEPVFTMDKETETELMFTKAVPGQYGDRTVIQDGRCLGYKYTVSPYINYALDNGVPKADGYHYIGIGHWGYLAAQQHGEMRFTVDATSAEVAKRNTTVMVISTEISLSELSSKVNGNISGKPQAFKLIKVVQPASSNEIGG